MTPAVRSRLLLLAGAALLVAAFFGFGLQKYLTLDALKANREALQGLASEHRAALMAGFFVFYVAVTALSLPGAAIMSLAGGAVFGFLPGVLLVSFASSLGATLACALARYLLRGWVQRRFGERLARINEGFEREGAFYLFSLRLIPVVPFFLINLAMGLTPMRLSTFYWVSQLGMLPGTVVYLNAGAQLGQVHRLSDVASPGLLLSLALLGIFPLLVKKVMGLVRAHRAGAAK